MWPSHWFLLTLADSSRVSSTRRTPTACSGNGRPSLISAIMGLCLPCLVLVILVDWRLRPRHPDGEDPIDVLIGFASFALLPVVGLLLCAIPALDAHAPAAFGRRLEYRVTEKVPVQARFRDRERVPVARPARVQRLRRAASISCRSIGRTRPAARPR